MTATTSSIDTMQAHRPGWLPRWMYSIPDVWGAFGDEHPLCVEERRDGDHLVVRAELPGIDPERDVDITIDDGTLRLRGERRMHREDAEADGFRSEFTYGTFVRRLPVPAATTEDDVEATYEDGILEVRIPLDGDEERTPTRIRVRRG
jgi:HSP20 family protein